MNLRAHAAVFALLVSAQISSGAEKPWIETKSQHFRVLTNTSPGEGRRGAGEAIVEYRPKDTERAEGVLEAATCGIEPSGP